MHEEKPRCTGGEASGGTKHGATVKPRRVEEVQREKGVGKGRKGEFRDRKDVRRALSGEKFCMHARNIAENAADGKEDLEKRHTEKAA